MVGNELKIEIFITRHQGLIDYALEIGLIDRNTNIISHATRDDIKGKVVCGVLPVSLAALTQVFCEIPLDLPPELRGKELNLKQVREYAQKPAWYRVLKLN